MLVKKTPNFDPPLCTSKIFCKSLISPIISQHKKNVLFKASKSSSSTNSLFTQRAQESPLATSVLVYLPSVPSYDCHDNDLVAMPIFRCHCVVFVAAESTSHLLIFLIASDSSSHISQYIMWDSYLSIKVHTHTPTHTYRYTHTLTQTP